MVKERVFCVRGTNPDGTIWRQYYHGQDAEHDARRGLEDARAEDPSAEVYEVRPHMRRGRPVCRHLRRRKVRRALPLNRDDEVGFNGADIDRAEYRYGPER